MSAKNDDTYTLGFIQNRPLQWVSGPLSSGRWRERDDFLPSSAQFENDWSYDSTPPACLH